MAAAELFLVDKSAWERRTRDEQVDARLSALLDAGAVAVCEVVALELLYSARSSADYEARRRVLGRLRWLDSSPDAGRVALEIQRALARSGRHRRPVPDLLIAATAITHGATVLHCDHDFDVIASVSALSAEWIVPRSPPVPARSG
ncbi:MAG: PIN domain nuclease [Herbiconiux sp.]|nr:PIN domain nuclease [Herbiconiux sp.]